MRVGTMCIFGALAIAAAAGCNNKKAEAPPAKLPVVLVSYPVVREVTDYEEVTGRTDPKPSVEIRPRVSGYLIKVPFKEGAVVKKGALLYEVNPEQYQADLDKAQANLEQGKARVQQLEFDFDRAQRAKNKNALSQTEYDKTRADLYDAQAAVSSYKAMLKKARINLEYTIIEAPFDGRVSRSLLDAGNLVKADETMLTSIVSLDPMYVLFDVDERTWLRLLRLLREKKVRSFEEGQALAAAHIIAQTGVAQMSALGRSPLFALARVAVAANIADGFGLPVQMGLADEEGFPHRGVVDFADNKLDAGTGTMRMRGRFRNPDGTLLTPGMFVRLRIAVGTPYLAALVPERAFGTDQGQKFLYVIDEKAKSSYEVESYVEYRKVKTGAVHDGARVVDEGLKLRLRPRSFQMLRTDPVPQDVLRKLERLQDKTFKKLPDFTNALAEVLAPETLEPYRTRIAQAALEDGPQFTLRSRSLKTLGTERVPEEVLKKLSPLEDKSFDKLADFLKALSKTLSAEQVRRYRTQIAQAAVEKVIVNGLQRARPDSQVDPKTLWERIAEGSATEK
jgi:multidrug efflux system membrane fusion protein